MAQKHYKTFILLQKRYFDLGYGITSFLKIVIAVFGIGNFMTGNQNTVIFMMIGYAIFCYLFGLAYVKFGWYTVEIEITNRFNLFVAEMRKTYKNKRFK